MCVVSAVRLAAVSPTVVTGSPGIGRVNLARENEVGGSCGQEVHINHVNI